MECRTCKDLLIAFLDGELSSRDRERISSHLENCTGCRNELESHQFTLDLADKLAPVHPDASLWNRIELRISPPMEEPGFLPRLIGQLRANWIPAAAFGTLGAVFLLVLLSTPGHPLDDEFHSFLQSREHLQEYHERVLFQDSFERDRLGRNPFSSPISLEYQNPFQE